MSEGVVFNKPMEWKAEIQKNETINNEKTEKRKTLMEELGLGKQIFIKDEEMVISLDPNEDWNEEPPSSPLVEERSASRREAELLEKIEELEKELDLMRKAKEAAEKSQRETEEILHRVEAASRAQVKLLQNKVGDLLQVKNREMEKMQQDLQERSEYVTKMKEQMEKREEEQNFTEFTKLEITKKEIDEINEKKEEEVEEIQEEMEATLKKFEEQEKELQQLKILSSMMGMETKSSTMTIRKKFALNFGKKSGLNANKGKEIEQIKETEVMDVASEKFTITCCVVGDKQCGKTSFVSTFINLYSKQKEDTKEKKLYSYNTDDVEFGGKNFRFNVWDTASSDQYSRFRALNYEEADIFIILFAINDTESYENVQNQWFPELNLIKPDVPILLIGTKSDIRSQNSKSVSITQGRLMAKTISAEKYMESSLNNKNTIISIFEETIRSYCKSKKVILDSSRTILKRTEESTNEKSEKTATFKRFSLKKEKKKIAETLENV